MRDDSSVKPWLCTRVDTQYNHLLVSCSTKVHCENRTDDSFVLSQRNSLSALLVFLPFFSFHFWWNGRCYLTRAKSSPSAYFTSYLLLWVFFPVGSLQCSLPAFLSSHRKMTEISHICQRAVKVKHPAVRKVKIEQVGKKMFAVIASNSFVLGFFMKQFIKK